MARLASQIKMGFYKTPVEVVNQISKAINISDKARLLDTCCGTGEALKVIVSDTDSETYGVELDKERFDKAKDTLDNVVWGDAIYELICSQKAFGLLWLNPPYDTDESDYDQKRERLEVQFLMRHWKYLQKDGVLLYIIPQQTLEKVASFFRYRCKNLTILRFPDDYYWDYQQVVIVCIKNRPTKSETAQNDKIFKAAIEHPYGLTTTEYLTHIYDIPAININEDGFIFRSRRLNPEEVVVEIAKSPVWNRVETAILPPTGMCKAHPLMPLREGHLAMLLASGMMDGEVIGEDGKRLIVKGSVKKVVDAYDEETETADKHIETDRYEIMVRAICFEPLEIIDIK